MNQILFAAAELCLAQMQRMGEEQWFKATLVTPCPAPPASGMFRMGTASSARFC